MLRQGKTLSGVILLSVGGLALADPVTLIGSGNAGLRSQIEAERFGAPWTLTDSRLSSRNAAATMGEIELSTPRSGTANAERQIDARVGLEAESDSGGGAGGQVSGEAKADASVAGNGKLRGTVRDAMDGGRRHVGGMLRDTAAAGAEMHSRTGAVADTAVETGTDVSASVEAQAEQSVHESLELTGALMGEVEEQVSGAIEQEVLGELDTAVDGEIDAAIDGEIGAEIAAAVESDLDGEMAGAIAAELEQEIDSDIDATVDSEVSDSIDAEVAESVEAEIETTLTDLAGGGS